MELSGLCYFKMNVPNGFAIFSQAINILIFIYFIIVLLKINALDVVGLLISAFGLLTSLSSNIVSALME